MRSPVDPSQFRLDADPGVPRTLSAELEGFVRSGLPDVLGVYGPNAKALVLHLKGQGELSVRDGQSGQVDLEVPEREAERLLLNSQLSQLTAGLMLVPTLFHLGEAGVLKALGVGGTPAAKTIRELAQLSTPKPVAGTLGNFYGALRMLGLQGWLGFDGVDEDTRLSLTPEGITALNALVARWTDVRALTEAYAALDGLHPALRGAGDAALAKTLTALVARSAARFDLAQVPGLSPSLVEQLGRLLDGAVLCPVLVALRMPVFSREGDRVVASAPSALELLKQQAKPAGVDATLLAPMLKLVEQQGLSQPGSAPLVLTKKGEQLMELASMAAAPVSYLRTYARLHEYLFTNGDPLGIAEDTHVDRLMNIFGSSEGISKRFSAEMRLTLLPKLFDELPLDEQPAGLSDMGCGDGAALRALAEFVISSTNRGRHLDTHPLHVIGADFFEGPRRRARDVLGPLAQTPGVKVAVLAADVNEPEAYDAAIKELGFKVKTAGGERVLGASDLLHTFMYLMHNRGLSVKDLGEAKTILRARVSGADRDVLAKALHEADGLGEASVKTASEPELYARVCNVFRTSFSDHGRLVPALVAAADLSRFVDRWSRFAWHGLVPLECHDPGPNRMRAREASEPWRPSELPLFGHMAWGMHYISSQYPMPWVEHQLAMALANITFAHGGVKGGVLHPAFPSVDRLSGFRSVSLACCRRR